MELACLDLLNSDWRDWRCPGRRTDRLEDPEWVRRLLDRWNLTVARPLDARASEMLTELRSVLRRLVDDFRSGKPLDRADVARLDAAMAAAPVCRRLHQEGNRCCLSTEPVSRDWAWVAAEIAASFAGLVECGDPGRLKACENPECLWVFYDESRNRSRRWCDATECGNLIRVRRFRARQRAVRSGPKRCAP